jgi:hypothetical protein
VIELSAPDDAVLDYLAREVILAHSNPRLLHDVLEELCHDTEEIHLQEFRQFVETMILDMQKTATLVGNFGEVVAAKLLVEFEGFWFPVYKLRFREKKAWAMRLTDLCLIKMGDLPQPQVCYGEVKTNSSHYNSALGIKGHDSLAKDDALTDPEVLRFLSNVLYEAEKFDEGRFLVRIWLDKISYTKRYDLFLVHDRATWRDEILDNLNGHNLDERLVNFSVKVLHIERLRHVIDSVYARTWIAAREVANG